MLARGRGDSVKTGNGSGQRATVGGRREDKIFSLAAGNCFSDDCFDRRAAAGQNPKDRNASGWFTGHITS
jgi:hypothetical protein